MGKLFDFNFMIEAFPDIIKYLPVTLEITLVSMILGIIIGLVVAIIKIYNVPILKNIASVYVSFIRGTPLLVQIYLSYYGIPMVIEYINSIYGTSVNINNIPPIVFVFLAFAINEGAYNSETIRASIQSVDKGQFEAAYSVGMTNFQAMRRIIIPQALVVAIPNLGNSLISLLKGTSLAFTVAVVDIMASAKIIGSSGMRFFEVYIVVALIYWAMSILIERLIAFSEKRIGKYERRRKID